MYICYPESLFIYHGSAYTSKEMSEPGNLFRISDEETIIETPGAFGVLKRYHAPLRLASDRVSAEADCRLTNEELVQLPLIAISCRMGPEGLCSALLIIRAILCHARTISAPLRLCYRDGRRYDKMICFVQLLLHCECSPLAKNMWFYVHCYRLIGPNNKLPLIQKRSNRNTLLVFVQRRTAHDYEHGEDRVILFVGILCENMTCVSSVKRPFLD